MPLQQKLLTQAKVAFGIGLPLRGIPAILQQRIKGFRDGFSEPLVESEVKRASIPVVIVLKKPW
jgi:hypothetical protein